MFPISRFKLATMFFFLLVVSLAQVGCIREIAHAASRPLMASTKVGGTPLTTTLSCGTWSVVSSPNAGSSNNTLNAVAAISADNVWAVGWYLDSNNAMLTLIEHWNGSVWALVSSANPGSAYNSLNGVAAISAKNIWAVGYYSNSTGSTTAQTLIEHWNGKTWSVVPSPNPGSAENLLYGVSRIPGTSQLWAVGAYYNTGNSPTQTLTEYWDGSSWNDVSSPNVGLGGELSAVSAISATNIWAAGSYSNSTYTNQTLIEHWNGTSWNVVSSPSPASAYNVLNGITKVPGSSKIWAIGYFDNSTTGPGQALIERWNGTSWSVVSSPNIGTGGNGLDGVVALSAKNVWVVGAYNAAVGSYSQTLIEYWNGTSWSVISSPNIGTGNNSLMGIAQVHGTSTLWAVGYYTNANNTTQTLIESYC